METRLENGNLIVSVNGGEVEFTFPKEGKDIARATVKINVSNKYTVNDIYVLKEKIVKDILGVEVKYTEKENG